jgi:hypothetical protein
MNMVHKMANEDIVLKLNKFAWLVCLLIGIGIAADGAYNLAWTAYLYSGLGSFYAGVISAGYATGVVLIVLGILGVIAGLMAKAKVVPLIDNKDFTGATQPLMVWMILGLIGAGSGVLLLVQFILIKTKK